MPIPATPPAASTSVVEVVNQDLTIDPNDLSGFYWMAMRDGRVLDNYLHPGYGVAYTAVITAGGVIVTTGYTLDYETGRVTFTTQKTSEDGLHILAYRPAFLLAGASGTTEDSSSSGGGPGSDTTAIHRTAAYEIASIVEKTTPVSADLLLIEDSAAGNLKKSVQVGNLPTSGSGDVVGPASATDTAIPLYDGTTGKLIKNSDLLVSASQVTIPGRSLYVSASSVVSLRFWTAVATSSQSSIFRLDKSSGSVASPGGVSSGETLGQFEFRGRDNAGSFGEAGSILATAVGLWTATNHGGELVFRTVTQDEEFFIPVERWKIKATGALEGQGNQSITTSSGNLSLLPASNIVATGKKITGLAAGTAAGDSVRYEQALLTAVARTLTAAITLGSGGKIDASGITGVVVVQNGVIPPVHDADIGTVYVDTSARKFYIKHTTGAGGSNWQEIGAGGGAVPHCRVYRSTNQNIANNTLDQIVFDTQREDNDNMWEGVTNPTRITFTQGGWYHVGACWQWVGDASATGSRYGEIQLNVGATPIVATQIDEADSSTRAIIQNLGCDYRFSAGDYIQLAVKQVAGVSLSVTAAGNYSPEFWATFLSS